MSNRTHYPEPHPPTCARRVNAAIGPQGTVFAAARFERDGRSRVEVLREDEPGEPMLNLGALGEGGLVADPDVCSGPDGTIHVAWTEHAEHRWRVLHAAIPPGRDADAARTSVLHAGDALCLPPALALAEGKPCVAWPAATNDAFQMMLAGPEGTRMVSSGAAHTFRPALAAHGGRLLLTWDRYTGERYEIVCRILDASTGEALGGVELRDVTGSWMAPSACADADGSFYVAWLQVREVEDVERGVVDHDVAALAARLPESGPVYLPEGGSVPTAAADLRPGLLAAEGERYCGYDGLRRRPQLTALPDGNVWLCWESRDREGHKRDGRLMARCLTTGPSPPVVLHRDAVSYAVPRRGTDIAGVFLPRDMAEEPVLHCDRFRPSDAPATPTDPAPWTLWSPLRRRPARVGFPPVETPDGPMRLYWLDTHCHSVQSPDAEGEPDELLHYARNVAALDGVAIVDNDYYPNKALAHAEWQAQQQMADAFTEAGRFVVFPAYEYTYHDADLTPDFNHRYVLYRRRGPLLRRIDPESHSIAGLERGLRGEDAFVVAHHCTWELVEGLGESVEVCSSWRVCIEELDFIARKLEGGEHFAFVGSSDSHRACPGMGGALTGVYAPELTRDAVFEALRAGRTIATQGRRPLMGFRAGGAFIGGAASVRGPVPLHVQVAAPAKLDFVEIRRGAETVARWEPKGRQMQEDTSDAPPAGMHSYYVRVKMEGDPSFNTAHLEPGCDRPFATDGPYPSNLARAHGPFAWSSPVRVEVGG